MAKPNNQWERDAQAMAARIEKQRDLGEQLTFLPDEVAGGDEAVAGGRPKGAKNKASTQLRDWLASQGMRMPEDVLTEIAGLRSRDDAITLAMARAERILTWAFDGAHIGEKAAPRATSAMRLDVFAQQYTIILRALEAVMPYTAAKASPDVAVTANITPILMPMPAQAARRAGDDARDVTAKPRRIGPPPMPHEIKQNQEVKNSSGASSDGKGRTE
jgi:hypothetical protein